VTAPSQIAAAMQQLIATRMDLMVDECVVTRAIPTDPTAPLDPGTGLPTAQAPSEVYTGPCTIAAPKDAPQRGRTVQDDSGVPNERVLRVPHVADLRPGDLVTVTASAFSPGLVGDRFVVVAEEERTYATYRRFIIRGSSWLAPSEVPTP
jgi:hypothetical protein